MKFSLNKGQLDCFMLGDLHNYKFHLTTQRCQVVDTGLLVVPPYKSKMTYVQCTGLGKTGPK